MSQRVFTIGAYGFDHESFFGALEEAGVDIFLDVRQRRGLRGARYAFANIGRLAPELARRSITYRHVKDASTGMGLSGSCGHLERPCFFVLSSVPRVAIAA